MRQLLWVGFVWMLSCLGLCGQQNLKSLYLENQPKDPFIDALRPRLKDSLLLSYLAYRNGEYAIEATTVTSEPAEHILDFYKKQFEDYGFTYQIKDLKGMALFIGTINGESKKVFLSKMNQGTLVHLVSEKSGLRFSSLLEDYPELKAVQAELTLHNEQHQGVSRTGLLKYDFMNQNDNGLRCMEERLADSGWKPTMHDTFKKAGIEVPDGTVAMFEKDSVTLMLVPARSRRESHSTLFVYFEDTFGVPKQKQWVVKK